MNNQHRNLTVVFSVFTLFFWIWIIILIGPDTSYADSDDQKDTYKISKIHHDWFDYDLIGDEYAPANKEINLSICNLDYGYKVSDIKIFDKENNQIPINDINQHKGSFNFIMPNKEIFIDVSCTTNSSTYNSKIVNYTGNFTWRENKKDVNIDFDWGFDLLTNGDNCTFSKNIALTSSILTGCSYYRSNGQINSNGSKFIFDNIKPVNNKHDINLLTILGFQDIKYKHIESPDKNYEKNDSVWVYFGYKPHQNTDKTVSNIYLCLIKGTDGELKEWQSNMDIGCNTKDYWALNSTNWENKCNHKGFDVGASLVFKELNNYINHHDYTVSYGKKCQLNYLLNIGHSRGGAISNLLGAKIADNSNENTSLYGIKSFTYTFAAPNTTTYENCYYSRYDSIWNIYNTKDIIPSLPYSTWGFRKYGKTRTNEDSEIQRIKGQYLKLTKTTYNNATDKQIRELKWLAFNIAKNREDIYKIPEMNERFNGRKCVYGLIKENVSKDFEELKNSDYSKFCQANLIKAKKYLFWIDTELLVRPSPAFCMNYIAHLASEGGSYVLNCPRYVEIDGVYNEYRWFFISSAMFESMSDPHLLLSYYLMIKNW